MRVIWINSGSTKTLSNTRLYGIPPIFNQWGDQTWVIIGGKRTTATPDYFLTLPIPFNRSGIYKLLVSFLLPLYCLRYKPDFLITDWTSAEWTRWVVLLRKLKVMKVKLIHDVRTVPVKEDGGKGRGVYSRALQYARNYFDGITTITIPLRNEICSEFQIHKDQIAVWTSGVDEKHFRPRDVTQLRRQLNLAGKFVLFYHGAVNENRGVVELVRAMEFLKDISELRLIIVGSGNQWGLLEQIVKRSMLEQVILKSSVTYAEMPDWISLADLCIVPLPDHPWWRVSSPLKLLEYLAMSKPILLTDMLAHRAVLPDDSEAFYVKNTEPEELARGIRFAISRRDSFEKMGKSGQKRASESYSWVMQAKRLKYYLQAVRDGNIYLKKAD
jgi:glycosyltransferase involved in cell wall biosynthesis